MNAQKSWNIFLPSLGLNLYGAFGMLTTKLLCTPVTPSLLCNWTVAKYIHCFEDHHFGKCLTCQHHPKIHLAALCFSLESAGCAIVMLCNQWRNAHATIPHFNSSPPHILIYHITTHSHLSCHLVKYLCTFAFDFATCSFKLSQNAVVYIRA